MTRFRNRLREALSDFVEFDDASNDNRTQQTQPPQQPQQERGTTPAPAAPPIADSAAVDADTVGMLEQALGKSAARGYDEFRALLAALEAVGDEGMRYALALKAVRASHQLGAADVLASVDDRMRLLQEEGARFETALARETDETVGRATREIETIATAIATKLAEVRELEDTQAALRQNAAAAGAALDRTRMEFAAAYASVHATLASERARIAAHGQLERSTSTTHATSPAPRTP